MTQKKKFFTLLISVVILMLCGVFFYNNTGRRAVFRKELKRFSQETYDSVLLSMHSTSGYTQENFMTYKMFNTYVSSYEIRSTKELQRYLEEIFSSGNAIRSVFLMLDPYILWNTCGKDTSRYDKALQNGLLSFVEAHPDVSFSILLPYPSLRYWVNTEQSIIDDTLNVYRSFIEDTYFYPNAPTYYMGFERWLLVNPDNYVSDFDVNDTIAKKIFLLCFADGINQITPINGDILFEMFQKQVDAERTSPAVYPDLSDYCLVFFGDSIMAYGEGTNSTPGYVTGFSDAITYNYAIGGTTANSQSPNSQALPNVLPRFLSEYCIEENGTYRFSPDGADVSDKKLCFLFTYGANDYFNGAAVDNPDNPYDITTYAGGLRSSVKKLMEAFPDAEFIVMTPNFTSYFSNGAERNSDIGGVLTDYVDAAVSVAKELGIHYMDNYHDFLIDASNVLDYTADGCHPNDNGRILMAEHIVDLIDSL